MKGRSGEGKCRAGAGPGPEGGPESWGSVSHAGLLGRAEKAGSPFGNVLVCILGLGGQRRGGASPSSAACPRVLLALHQSLAGGKVQGAPGAGHSGTTAKAAPEVAKLVLLGRVSAGAPLSLMY